MTSTDHGPDPNPRRRPSRRTVATGAAWAIPTIAIGAPAPAIAASTQDVVVSATPCTDGSNRLSNIPFEVSTLNDATLPIGTEFSLLYAGGSTQPTWSGLLAENSTAVITPGNDSSWNGGRWGAITFTLIQPMPAGVTWPLIISMDIGVSVTGQSTSLTLTSSVPAQNHVTSNDSASHSMYFGGCGS